ncbi:MAG: phosphopantetheine-binding protein [Desulfobacteraceae bacterium]|jgi:acyl carrier protein|nr:phosphopantetheine-binding protein [Desulfobacteraceae bacterium]
MPVDENILKELYDILIPFVPQGQQLTEETDMIADLGLDSLKVMKIVETVEDGYDISIPLNILPEVRTVGDFAFQIQKIIGEG